MISSVRTVNEELPDLLWLLEWCEDDGIIFEYEDGQY